jgi:hypothetical protein
MGPKSPRSILSFEFLDCGRRTDAKRGDKAKRVTGCFRHDHERGAHKERDGPINRTTENSGVGYGADRALVAGELGIVSVNVDSLDNADEGNEQDTQQRQSRSGRAFARLVSR